MYLRILCHTIVYDAVGHDTVHAHEYTTLTVCDVLHNLATDYKEHISTVVKIEKWDPD